MKKNKYFVGMFNTGTIVKVLVPNIVNTGYDYRLTAPADVGTFVGVTIMNRPYVGVVWGFGDSGLPESKIKNVTRVYDAGLNISDLQWIKRMSDWTLMAPGAVLRLIINVPDAFLPPRMEQLYSYNPDSTARMTENRIAVADAFASNDFDAMSVTDIQNIARVSSGVVRTMIKNGTLIPTASRETNPDQFVFEYNDAGNIVLNDEQAAAAAQIGTAISSGGFSVHLLDGITGSGKTQ
ncbi:MAG: hypothetical protein IJO18_03640, partial [Alphaproteobacteria bacterium]|nr:hypothetical protein [Alphaproteobacteria bacterium]